MKSRSFRRFVAIFVGVLLAVDVAVTILVGDEQMLMLTLGVGVIYAIYMTVFLKKEKQEKAGKTPESPLKRR